MEREPTSSIDRFVSASLWSWVVVTLVVSASGVAWYALGGRDGVSSLIQRGALSITSQTLVCVAIVWCAWGIALFVLRTPRSRRERGVPVVLSLLVLCLYVNVLRERSAYGDVEDYVQAAVDLYNGRALHPRYLYPPLLATLCASLVPLGKPVLVGALWSANILSLVAFYWLLRAALVRYGLGGVFSSLAVFVFMIVNVPILRTLGYVQVNLHVTNLILAALLLLPRRRMLSAVALATAAHVKVSPLVLALPFLWRREGTWSVSFVLALGGLAVPTLLLHGAGPFGDFVHNAQHIASAVGLAFRDNSVDSLVRGAGAVLGRDLWPLVVALKAAVLLVVVAAVVRNVRDATFRSSRDADHVVHNALPGMLIAMTLAAPVLWEHHAVFLALPFLLVAPALRSPLAWTWYGFAYLLEFVVPTFDVYPWSYGRLVSPIVLACLMLRISPPADNAAFVRIRDALESAPLPAGRLSTRPAP